MIVLALRATGGVAFVRRRAGSHGARSGLANRLRCSVGRAGAAPTTRPLALLAAVDAADPAAR
ncbi:MAG: hypothetical protein AB7N53_12435 [Candidatus Binatia bacterium]